MSRLLTTVLVLSVLFGALFLLRQQPAASGDMPLADWPLGGKSGPITLLEQPRTLPEIQFVDGDNRPYSLTDFRGKVLLLNIWATWCPPCRKEMPSLDRLQARLADKDFLVVPLSTDLHGHVQVERFYRESGIHSLGVFLDPTASVSMTLKAPGLPATYLIDREGRALGIKFGPAEWDGDEFIELIEGYL